MTFINDVERYNLLVAQFEAMPGGPHDPTRFYRRSRVMHARIDVYLRLTAIIDVLRISDPDDPIQRQHERPSHPWLNKRLAAAETAIRAYASELDKPLRKRATAYSLGFGDLRYHLTPVRNVRERQNCQTDRIRQYKQENAQ
jgi:hypothetical protein